VRHFVFGITFGLTRDHKYWVDWLVASSHSQLFAIPSEVTSNFRKYCGIGLHGPHESRIGSKIVLYCFHCSESYPGGLLVGTTDEQVSSWARKSECRRGSRNLILNAVLGSQEALSVAYPLGRWTTNTTAISVD